MTTEVTGNSEILTATSVGGLTLAHQYLGDAVSYLSAAKLLDEHEGHFSPKYFLLSHAIELALKAYILATGGTEKQTKKIRHDLNLAWQKAVANGLRSNNSDLPKIIERIAPAHLDYSFRYNRSWSFILPQAEVFEAAVSDLINNVLLVLQQHPAILRIA
jgi:hypothetical protein